MTQYKNPWKCFHIIHSLRSQRIHEQRILWRLRNKLIDKKKITNGIHTHPSVEANSLIISNNCFHIFYYYFMYMKRILFFFILAFFAFHRTIERFDGFFMNEFSEWMDIGQWRLLLQDLIWRLKKLDNEKFPNVKKKINEK